MNSLQVERIDIDTSARQYLAELAWELPKKLTIGHETEAVSWVEDQIDPENCDLPPTFKQLKEAVDAKVGLIEIHGVPLIGEIPGTPNRYQPVESADIYQFDIAHIAIASLVGRPYGYNHVRGGRILGDIFPRQDLKHKKDSAFGSLEAFDFHADGAVQPDTRAQYFSFQSIRNPIPTPTIVSTVSLADFTAETAQRLQEPVYELFYEGRMPGAHSIKNVSIIELADDDKIQLNYSGSTKVDVNLDSGTEPYLAALQAFHNALHSNQVTAQLNPGDIALVNNLATLHSRPAFIDCHLAQADRRWLRRLYIATDGDLLQRVEDQPSRILVSSSLS